MKVDVVQCFNQKDNFVHFFSMLTFDRSKILGTGYFGIVFEGLLGETKVAVKRIPIHHAATNQQEEKALKTLDHINVNKLFHVEEDQDFKY